MTTMPSARSAYGAKVLALLALLGPMALSALTLGGCGWLEPHRIPIQQGNVVTQEMVDQLEPGMTRSQVAFVLGEPIMQNGFDQDRWDYVYSLYNRDRELNIRRVSLFFQNDRLSHFAGDLAPGAADDAEPIEMPELEDLETDMPPAGTDPTQQPRRAPAPQPRPDERSPQPGPRPGPGTSGPGPQPVP